MKRHNNIIFGASKKQKKAEVEEVIPQIPSVYSSLLNQLQDNNEDEMVFLEGNHLYFLTDVSDESVYKVRKLANEYAEKYLKYKKSNIVNVTPKPLVLHINSAGGSVHAGFILYDFIKEYQKNIPVYTVVEGVVASAATIISIAGTKRFITETSYMLIHQLSTFMGGKYEELKDEMANCNKVMKKIIDIYEKHTKINKKKIPDLLKHDLLWNANECIKYGIVDEIKTIDIFSDF